MRTPKVLRCANACFPLLPLQNPPVPTPSVSGSPLQTPYLPSLYSCLSREYTWLFSSANVPFSKEEALIAGFHIFQEKMFRLGGITILGKCGLLKKKMAKKKNFLFLCWQEIRKENPGALLRPSVFDYGFFFPLNRCFIHVA